MSDEIVKVCKKHGELRRSEVGIYYKKCNHRGGKIYPLKHCIKCKKEYCKIWRLKRISKKGIKEKDRIRRTLRYHERMKDPEVRKYFSDKMAEYRKNNRERCLLTQRKSRKKGTIELSDMYIRQKIEATYIGGGKYKNIKIPIPEGLIHLKRAALLLKRKLKRKTQNE